MEKELWHVCSAILMESQNRKYIIPVTSSAACNGINGNHCALPLIFYYTQEPHNIKNTQT